MENLWKNRNLYVFSENFQKREKSFFEKREKNVNY